MPLRLLLIALLVPLLGACRSEQEQQQSLDIAQPAAAPGPPEAGAATAAGAELAVNGQPAFQGASPFFCVPHAENGLQVDFRTGNLRLPAVAVRIEDYRGSGPYRARLFVTGRSPAGALVTSAGEANVELRQQSFPDGATALVSGSFRGSYEGEAGQGTIQGRFGSCSYSATRNASPPLAAGAAAPSMGGREEQQQPAGASEETP